MPLEKQVMILYAVIKGYLDDIPVDKISSVEEAFHRFMETNHPDVGKAISSEKTLSDSTEDALKKSIIEFKQTAPVKLQD
jgi:F-type H+-transporting ATPase subunit alpha